MGINALWQLLRAEEMVEWYRGNCPSDHQAMVAAVDGKAVAIDLATWLMQADQQQALTPHFSREERCMKVAFERAVQWLRHGCLPVVVVEGRPPAEKQAAQQARFAARNGYAGGGSQAGASHFQRLGQTVGKLLEELGLPVFYAPGEAEAVCAALNRAGCVDAAASSDSDTLLYGAETLLHTLKLQAAQPRECELKRVNMFSIRRRLGLERGGAKALGVLAMLSGSDYDLDGAQGVGSAGGLAVARHLLQGDADDSQVLQRLADLVQRAPNQELLELDHCTGCQSCGHEGGRKGKIKRHSSRNPCPCCPPSEDGSCREVAFERCACPFHQLETERRVERILERVRRSPGFLQEAQAAISVFERQRAAADAYVQLRLQELGLQTGQRLQWLHRPRVRGVFDIIEEKRRQMLWDLPAIRSKLLPVLLEWDLQRQAAGSSAGSKEAEFRAVAIQKVHGLKARGEALSEAHWRYVLTWERLSEEADLEHLGCLEVRPKKPRANSKAAAAAAAAAGADESDDDGGGAGSMLPSQGLLSQRSGPSQGGSVLSPGAESQTELLTLHDFDMRWMKEQPAEHRAVRISAVHRLLPALEQEYEERCQGGGKAGGAAAGKKAGAAAGGVRKPRGRGASAASKAARQLDLGEQGAAAAGAGEEEQSEADRQLGDLTRYLAQRKAGEWPHQAASTSAAAAALASKQPTAAAIRGGYGLAGRSAAGAGVPPRQQAQQQRQQLAYAQHLPATAASMEALLSRALGGSGSGSGRPIMQEQAAQRPEHPPPQQHSSPAKKLRSPAQGGPGAASTSMAASPAGGGTAAALAAAEGAGGGSEAGSPSFEVLLSSPESPADNAARQQMEQQRGSRRISRVQTSEQRMQVEGPGGHGNEGGDGEDEGDDLIPLPLALRMAQMMGRQQQARREGHASHAQEPPLQQQQQPVHMPQQAAQAASPQQQQGQQQGQLQAVGRLSGQGSQRAPRRGKRSSSSRTPGSAGRDIRTFLVGSPPHPMPPLDAAAGIGAQAEARAAAVALGQQAAPGGMQAAPVAAALAGAGAGSGLAPVGAAAAADDAHADNDDVVDLTTPPRPRVRSAALGAPGAALPVVSGQQQQQRQQQGGQHPQGIATLLGGSTAGVRAGQPPASATIDLTLSD